MCSVTASLARRGDADAVRMFDRGVGLCAASTPERVGFGGLTMTDSARLVIELDRQRMIALTQMDIDKVKEFLSDELVWTHTSGRVDTRESQITSMKSGEIVYSRYEPSDVKAQDYGDFVVITGKADIQVDFRGTRYPLDVRFTDGWHRKDGTWKMVFWQATTFTYTDS
jgi:ketosteroid isomerase-like protein